MTQAPTQLLIQIGIGLGYFLLGWFGSLFTIEPGFASAIWPAAGVALALYLKYGSQALPWIFIGSFFANLQTGGLTFTTLSLTEGSWTAFRSLGSILQLLFSHFLLRHYCGGNISFISFPSLLKALLICGPIACIVAASLGTFSLFQQGYITEQTLGFVWFTWWTGDCVGVLFFLPLTLVLIGSGNVKMVENRLPIFIASIIMFAIVCITFNYSKQVFAEKLHNEFQKLTANQLAQLNTAKHQVNSRLLALSALFKSQPKVARAEFAAYTQELIRDTVNYRAVGWVAHVPSDQLANWYQALANDNLSDVKIRKWTPEGLVTATQQEYYLPITYLEPQAINEKAIGLELASHPVASQAVFAAIESKNPQATKPMRLAQQGDKYTGNVIYYPVFNHNDQLSGLVEVVIELDELVKSILHVSAESTLYHYRAYDTRLPEMVFADSGFQEKSLVNSRYKLQWFGREWLVEFSSNAVFDNTRKDWTSWLTLTLGLLLATFGMAFILVLTNFNSRLKSQVDIQTQQLQNLVSDLESASKAKSTFLANMSHELRTPLNAIIGFVSIAKSKVKDNLAIDYFERIKYSSDLLLNAINQVLDISKIEAGKLHIEQHPFILQDSITRLVSVFSESAKQKSLYFYLDQEQQTMPTIISDQTRIEQIITNLLSNAIKFTEKGGVTFSVNLFSDEQQHYLKLVVQDTGIGVPEIAQQRLFQQFEQADTSTTRKYGGTGLGLSITYELVNLLQGDILIDSQEGQGSSFIVTLPVELAPEHKGNEQSGSALANDNNLTPLNVLLVEDNNINQIVICEMLKLQNCTVVIANNGQEALDQLQSIEDLPDLILMDIQMPIMDGYTATRKISADPHFSHIPIVGLSANASTDDIQQGIAAGMLKYLTKPIDQNRLTELLQQLREGEL